MFFGWLTSLRAYLGAILVGDLLWESLQLPLYTIWKTGTFKKQAFAVAAPEDCRAGDSIRAR